MYTLGAVPTHLQLLATLVIFIVVALIIKKLYALRGVLINLKTQFVDSCNNLLLPVVQTLKNIRAWHVNRITVESSIKAEPTFAKVIHTATGQQQATTVAPTLQPVSPQRIPKPRHAERTKSGRFAPKGTGVVLTPMVNQLQGHGKSSKTVANQLRQHAKVASKKGQ